MSNTFKNSGHDQILILDFGSQYSHLIARRIRELSVYCELHSCLVDVSVVREIPNLRGIILSGGPFSVYEEGAPHLQKAIWDLAIERKLPVLGICYGFQETVHTSTGGKVEKAAHREFGHAVVTRARADGASSNSSSSSASSSSSGTAGSTPLPPDLFAGLPATFNVWMSHGDKITAMPTEGAFSNIGTTDNTEFAAVAGWKGASPVYGIQFHPEVSHTPLGINILRNFVIDICASKATWSMDSYLEAAIESIRSTVGAEEHVIGAVSGGVDSTVAAVLLQRAIGDRFHAIMVDNGLLRLNEAKQVVERLRDSCGVNLRVVDASARFLDKLAGIAEPEAKRKVIGNEFIHVFQEEAAALGVKAHYLLQGTLYPDVIESVSFKGPSATIKTHHNVGGLLANMSLKLIEPLRELFKDEVRALGLCMGIPEDSIYRHPFPGPGLGIRILGAVDAASCELLRRADDIYIAEIKASGDYKKTGQAFAVLLPCKTVGVMGDARTYERVLALRAVATSDYMTADWYHMPYDVLSRVSTRIINEVRGINRVVYDISSKPPATIEWE